MPLILRLTCDQQTCRAKVADTGKVLAETPLQDIPDITEIVGDPPNKSNRRAGDPYGAGERLFAALGGTDLQRMLESAADGLLLLACDEGQTAYPGNTR
ncbi:hypothetical protein [Chloroflexus sp.]|uniref:hypothetical protein n=1 Tax=Chloroflexus sp. TaxID=1904827 RepID=UPI002ADE2152|nr:hypothetical protein [Chloroflexus sp.]